MDEKKAKGIVFTDTVEFLREKKGDGAVAELERSFGPLIFDPHRMYPLADPMKLQGEAIRIAFGGESDEAYKALGAAAYASFTRGVVGATLTNVARSPKALLEKIQELWGTVLDFGSRKLVSADEAAHTAVVEIKDDPRDPAYLEGVIEAGLKSIGIEAHTEVASKRGDDYKIEVRW